MKRRRNWVFEILFILVALGVGVGFSLRPWRAYQEQKKVSEGYRIDMEKAEKRSEELIKQKARADSALGREEKAREQGHRRSGEIPFGASE